MGRIKKCFFETKPKNRVFHTKNAVSSKKTNPNEATAQRGMRNGEFTVAKPWCKGVYID